MGIFARISHKIGENLVCSGVVKGEDTEIYIYGINQIFVSVLNVFSALFTGWIFGVLLEIVVFMVAYIPLRTFAGGYHAKTPLRCYIFSVIMLIFVSIGMKHISIADWVYYVLLVATALIVIVFSPVEDKNKPLYETESKVYKRRAVIITVTELFIGSTFKLTGLDSLFVAVVYSFTVLCIMLIAGKAKNYFWNKRFAVHQ